MENEKLIVRFYESFARGDADGMAACYHDEIEFSDPAFGPLKGADARDMWRMLVERSRGQIEIAFRNVAADAQTGAADWTADYLFSKTGRRVFNEIHAEFEFLDGKIYRHRDAFDLWKWSRQALGLAGLFLGWSGFLQNKIRQNALSSLNDYKSKNNR
ncbi:MAG: nuclear transport factor 2 family protein [Acidobacteria bacterium]|nr:nuclear transport factor 2 family protein [Acidobacteriota bacterium]